MKSRQRGQVLALIAVLLPALVLGLGLIVDTAVVFQARRQALALADAAADYGAAQIDQAASRANPSQPAPIDPAKAQTGAQQYVLEHQPGAVVSVTATRQVVVVSVTLQAPTLLWHLPGQSTVAIQATGRSQPFSGVETGQAP
jgi:Flp pilus assembly protein TadG